MEGKKAALMREASLDGWDASTLEERLAELESVKRRPYGTLNAVSASVLVGFCTSFEVLPLPLPFVPVLDNLFVYFLNFSALTPRFCFLIE